MNWLSQNWQSLLSVAALAASALTYTVHHLGHVEHHVVIDDIADYLNRLNSTLNKAAGGTTNPQPPVIPASVEQRGA